ncbi:diguanylate cyclase domain-containing protein [Teichococcus vastitatis]|uniref:diguanylate cyclase domain-containing protein n=1 Tax=Teichococcus vastitatis TaxID=2307076 RepID=UPI000E73B61B|nr:diguanylate cyclase [Pseudoroseomonas vastitatis]
MTIASEALDRRVWLLHRAAAVMGLLGLLASLMLWHITWRSSIAEADARFRDSSQHVTRLVEERMMRVVELVAGFRGLFSVNNTVTRQQFHAQATALRLPDRVPGLQVVQYCPLVLHAARGTFEASVRDDRSLDPGGYPDFAFRPSGSRAFYLPVLYNEPMAGNEAAFGHDMAAEPSRWRSVEQARDSGEAAASAPLPLLQGETGIVIRQALYHGDTPRWTVAQRRVAFAGVVGAVLRTRDMLGTLLPETRNAYQLLIEDRGAIDGDTSQPRPVLAASGGFNAMPDAAAPADRLEQVIPVAGRIWAVVLVRPPASLAFAPAPLAALLCGCAVTATLWWLLHGLARHYESASSIAGRLAHAAQHDGLTGLPNRRLLGQRLEEAITAAERHKGGMALIFIDLDRFKPINDTLGHEAGDMVLRQVALRLSGVVRPSDTVARLGGDEFVVLLCRLPQPDLWRSVADRIGRSLDQPMSYGGQRVSVGASLGVALYPQHGTDAESLLRHADEAMYNAKRSRRAMEHAPVA